MTMTTTTMMTMTKTMAYPRLRTWFTLTCSPAPLRSVRALDPFRCADALGFLLGETIDLVLGFRNKGSKNFNVTEIFTSLRWPMDYSVFVQNVRHIAPSRCTLC